MLLPVPPGTSIRPMGLAMWIILSVVVTWVVGSILAVSTIVRWWRHPVLRLNGLGALFLSFTPFWVGPSVFHGVCRYRGLILSD